MVQHDDYKEVIMGQNQNARLEIRLHTADKHLYALQAALDGISLSKWIRTTLTNACDRARAHLDQEALLDAQQDFVSKEKAIHRDTYGSKKDRYGQEGNLYYEQNRN